MSQLGAVYEVPSQPSAVIKPARARHRRRLRDFLVRLLMIVIVIVALLGVAIQILLTTDIPKNLVVSNLERQLGLRVTASSMQSGWMGRSNLEDVTLALPLAEESFLQVPQLKIKHSTLFSLMLRQPIHIDEMYFDRPHLIVRQNALGRWNVEEAMALITRAAGGKSAANEQKSTGQPVQLPLVSLTDGTLELIDNENRKVTLTPLEIRGTPERSLSWHFTAAIASMLKLEGRIAPGQSWNHQVEFTLQHVEDALKPWFPTWPTSNLAGNWAGQVSGDSVLGRLDVKTGQLGAVAFNGAIKFSDTNGAATIQPEVLMVNLANSQTPIRIISGALKIADTRIDAQALDIAAMGGTARLDGHYDWHARAGEINSLWMDMTLPGEIRHSGELQASIDTPFGGQPQIKASLHTQGKFSGGDWNSHMSLLGAGPSWDAVSWRVNVSDLEIREPDRRLALSDLNLILATRGNSITLEDLRLNNSQQVRAGGSYSLTTGDWWLWLDTRDIQVPGIRKPVTLSFNSSGSENRIDLSQLYYRSGKFEVSASGSYVFDLPKPLDLYLDLWRIPIVRADDPDRPLGGMLDGKIRANGTLWPRNIGLSGNLSGQDVILGRRKLGNLAIQLSGEINEQFAHIQSEKLELLEGQWTLGASYRFKEDLTQLDLAVQNLSLKQADAFFSPPSDMLGTLAANLHLDLPHQSRTTMTGKGEWSINGFEKNNVKAEQITGLLAVDSDNLIFHNIKMREGSGSADGSVRFNLREPAHLSIQVSSQNWPIENLASQLALQLSGTAKVELNAKEKTATGPLQLNTAINLKNKPVGNLSFDTNLTGKAAEMKSIAGSIFSGTVDGKGILRWDDILKSTGNLQWHNIESAALAEMWPQLSGIHGTVSGSIQALPAANPEVNEPLELDISLNPESAWFRVMNIGNSDARVFIGPQRMVLESSLIHLAHGEARLWGRITRHEKEFFSHAQMDFKELSLNELVQSTAPGAAPMSGAITGQLTLFGPTHSAQLLNGEAEVRITRSDLANNAIIGGLYDAMRLHIGHEDPSGEGRASLRLEQGVLYLTNLYYRNRGAEVRASGRASDIFRGGDSPITGYAVGSARPLREMKLPFFAEADDILNALQKSVTTFRVTGRLHAPILQPAGFSEIGSDLRGFILGDVTSEQNQRSAK
jgi:hypothetical protein